MHLLAACEEAFEMGNSRHAAVTQLVFECRLRFKTVNVSSEGETSATTVTFSLSPLAFFSSLLLLLLSVSVRVSV